MTLRKSLRKSTVEFSYPFDDSVFLNRKFLNLNKAVLGGHSPFIPELRARTALPQSTKY